MGVEEHSNLNVGRISVKPISRSRILIHITIYSLGQSVEKIDPATGVKESPKTENVDMFQTSKQTRVRRVVLFPRIQDSRESPPEEVHEDWGSRTASVVPLVSYSGPALCARACFIAGYQEACCAATRCGTPLELRGGCWKGAARASAPFRVAHWMFSAAAGQ